MKFESFYTGECESGHSVLPKSTKEASIKENFDVFDWSIPKDLVSKFLLSKAGVHLVFLFPNSIHLLVVLEKLLKDIGFVNETHVFYKNIEELWDGEL
ncbi:putative 3-beta-(or 20-alpha)-hydroxysteroid dehydrogenase [Rosa chinensis]|uniref:Putative 3-beta-(Or 20-alpha)-hydroxysteroid dehydrogenase n=1 Tax=Rosa chinensis TaxID=74649 RepID=A0A2P6QRL0_ROSCH|nr:putative 3-beta-(or 20-alpha)-hydroxysteroid dehydrogenase [Rosa chinensis]